MKAGFFFLFSALLRFHLRLPLKSYITSSKHSKMNAENTFEYNSTQYKELIKNYRTEESKKHQLIVFVGEFDVDRASAIDELKRETMGEALEIDLAEIITPIEEESYTSLDNTLENIGNDVPLVIFRNAEQLSGAYTGFTNSNVKYSTPQEKYFIKKAKEIPVPVVVELSSLDQLGKTLSRQADAVVLFNPPTSILEKLTWKFKNVHIHGSRFLSPRPLHK